MNRAWFESHSGATAGWRCRLENPVDVHVARTLADVPALVSSVEAAADEGLWCALVLAYEAAPAFDAAYSVHRPNLPLAWAATYRTPQARRPSSTPSPFQVGTWSPAVSRETYFSHLERIRRYIRDGDTYQVNYTFGLTAPFSGDCESWYRSLCTHQGAGFSAYLDMGSYQVLSLSPEMFFRRDGNTLIARPMKGTARPGQTPAETKHRAQRLRDSEKDRAENLMIVDLLRNDLSRVATLGSVRVPRLFTVEEYPTVLQMTSTVEAECPGGTSLWQLLQALFPCGSVTGAPKVRTMEIIRELENQPRGLYCGAIGYVAPGGDCVFNVPIRTVLVDRDAGHACFATGSGITDGSDPAAEYRECLLKAQFLRASTSSFSNRS